MAIFDSCIAVAPADDHTNDPLRFKGGISILGYSNLPVELTLGFLFCCWKRVPIEGQPGKLKKRPIKALTGKSARANRPGDFTGLEHAINACLANDYAGLGRRMQHGSDQIYAVDVDHCVDENGRPNDYARDLIQRAGSYAEITPSGHGIRIFGRASVPPALSERSSTKIWPQSTHPFWPEVEVQLFLRDSYVTLSGDRIAGTPMEIAENQAFLDYLLRQNTHKVRQYFPDETCTRPRIAAKTSQRAQERRYEPPAAGEIPNTNRTHIRIARRRQSSAIFDRNWQRKQDPHHTHKTHKTDSEFQRDLVVHFYVVYQPPRADLVYMCRLWCKMHSIRYQEHRMESWLRDAQEAFGASRRKPYRQYETERKRAYRAHVRGTQHPTTNTVGMRDNVGRSRFEYGDLTNQVLSLRNEGKSQYEIAKILGRSRSTIATTLARQQQAAEKASFAGNAADQNEDYDEQKELRALYEKHLWYGDQYGYWKAEEEPYTEPSFEDWRDWFEKIEPDHQADYLEYLEDQESVAEQEEYWERRRKRESQDFWKAWEALQIYGDAEQALRKAEELKSIPDKAWAMAVKITEASRHRREYFERPPIGVFRFTPFAKRCLKDLHLDARIRRSVEW